MQLTDYHTKYFAHELAKLGPLYNSFRRYDRREKCLESRQDLIER